MKEELSKIDVAERLLKTAIKLFFERRDSISIHLLASSSHQILHDLSKRKLSLVKCNPIIREDKRKELIDIVNSDQNFFKHADRYPDAKLSYDSERIRFFLLDAVYMYHQISKCELFVEARVFNLWHVMYSPDLFLSDPIKNEALRLLSKGIAPGDFNFFLDMIEEFHEIKSL